MKKTVYKKILFIFLIFSFFIHNKSYSSGFYNDSFYNTTNNYTILEEKTFHILDIKDEEISFHDFSVDMKKPQDIWKYIKDIIPSNYLKYISKFKIYTDGYENTLAYVSNDLSKENKWILSIDINDSFHHTGILNERIKDTILHEFMHIITLNDSQMDNLNTEKTYTIAEGKLKKTAFLNEFYNKFWAKHEEYIKKEESLQIFSEEYNKLTDNFYALNKDEFLTKYASTNPVEDIAETFIYFIKEDIPLDNSIKSQKIRFLYTYKEFTDIKNFILSNIIF